MAAWSRVRFLGMLLLAVVLAGCTGGNTAAPPRAAVSVPVGQTNPTPLSVVTDPRTPCALRTPAARQRWVDQLLASRPSLDQLPYLRYEDFMHFTASYSGISTP